MPSPRRRHGRGWRVWRAWAKLGAYAMWHADSENCFSGNALWRVVLETRVALVSLRAARSEAESIWSTGSGSIGNQRAATNGALILRGLVFPLVPIKRSDES